MLELININKSYEIRKDKYQQVLKDLNVKFPNKGFISILGTSGSGKTTLLNILGGLDSYDSGTICYNQIDIVDYEQFRRDRIGFVFQEHNLIDHLNAVDNVMLSMTDDNEHKKEKAKEILKKLGLESSYHKKPNQLSGGQRQRVAIARMIAKNVDIIICDEPTGSLDEATGKKIVEIIKDLSKERLVIFVTHDRNLAEAYSDEILQVNHGKVNDIELTKETIDSTEVQSKSYNSNVMWLAFKNLLGRHMNTLKNILLITFIMLLSSVAIIMEGEFFKQYIHENAVEDGIRTINLNIENEADYGMIAHEFKDIDHVSYAGTGHFEMIRVAASNYETTRKDSRTLLEDITGNAYYEEALTAGRMPEASDEVLMSVHGVISLMRELGVGGDRLYDQYMTGEMTNEYVYGLIERRLWIIAEYGYPRAKVVGLIDDSKVCEEQHTFYYIEGFTELFEYPGGLDASKIILYKDDLYREAHDSIMAIVDKDDRVSLDSEHQRKSDLAYNKMHSFLHLSKVSLYLIISIAIVSLISLLFNSILERKYEIGLYRSKGYHKRNITRILGTEMFFVGLVAILLVVTILMIFAVFVLNNVDYLESYSAVLDTFNMVYIIGGLMLILTFFISIIIYIGNRSILKKSILSNIKDI